MRPSNTAEKLPSLNATALEQRKNALLRRTRRSGRGEAAWRCTLCGGRIDVRLKFDANDKEAGSRGACRTVGCLTWED